MEEKCAQPIESVFAVVEELHWRSGISLMK